MFRSLHIIFAIAVHAVIILVINPYRDTMRVLKVIGRLPRIVTLQNEVEYEFALRITRKIGKLLNLNRICSFCSLILFWVGGAQTTIHFGLYQDQGHYYGHAWIHYAGKNFTTDQSFLHESVYAETKSL